MEIVRVFLRMCAEIVRAWRRRRALQQARRDLRTRCEDREQRMEDANISVMPLQELHSLVYVAFASTPTSARLGDLEPLLDTYVEVAIARRTFGIQLRRAARRELGARLIRARRWHHDLQARVLAHRIALCQREEATANVIDAQLADITQLIRMSCEQVVYARAA